MKNNLYAFLMKKHLYMLDNRLKPARLPTTVKQPIRKNSAYCLKNQAIFFIECTYR